MTPIAVQEVIHIKDYLVPLVVGLIAGTIDILPMLKQRLDKYSIRSAFAFHVIMPFLVFNLGIAIPWWIRGGLVYLVCSIPILFLAAKDDMKSTPIIAITSVVIGTVVGAAAHFCG